MLESERVDNILVALIEPNKFNPNVMQDTEFQALKQDMKQNGSEGIDPILVSPYRCFYAGEEANPFYVIVDGEHRWKAAKELLWESIRCEVRELNEEEAKSLSYRKNKDRGTIDPFKEAELFKSELDLGLKQADVAEKFLVDPSTVSHRLSLLKLSPEVKKQIEKLPRGTVTPSHLEPIAALPEGEQKKIELVNKYGSGEVRSVRDISDEAKRVKERLADELSLKKALETAKFPKCPKCKSPPGEISYQKLPWVDCSKQPHDSEHSWNLQTGEPRYKPTYTRQSSEKAKRPEVSRVIRSNFIVKDLADAFFLSIRETLPQLENAKEINVAGIIGKEGFRVEFHRYGGTMRVYVTSGSSSIGITAEEKAYRTGEKSKVDISDWNPTKEDITRHIEFIDNAFKNVLLPLPEKKTKRLKEDTPELPGDHERQAADPGQQVPCTECVNDSENGGDCHREHFHADDQGGYICERRVLIEAPP
jgi:ParB/RepB/Spo0J family partition protein